LLIEFQSTVDHYMAVRLMSDIGLLYQDLIKTRQPLPDKRLPPVFPVVLYNGDRRWRAPTELAELIATLPGGLAHYRPARPYLILDEGAYDPESLDPLPNLVATIFRLEHHHEPAAILEIISNLIEWLAAPEQPRLRRSFSVWINRVLHVPGENRPTEPNDLREIKTMLAQHIPQWLQEARLQGKAQGEARGEARGKAQTLLKLLQLKFGPLTVDMEQRVHAAAKTQLDAWVERILTAERLEEVWGGPLPADSQVPPQR
jgi:hypothetical protein